MSKKFQRNTELQTSLLPDGHAIIVNPKNDWASTVSPLGALVWEYCDGTNTVEDIVRLVGDVAQVTDTARLHTDVQSFVEQFEEEGFFQD